MVKQIIHSTSDLALAGIFILVIGFILGLSEMLNKKKQLKSATTRKMVHMSVGIISAFSPWYFSDFKTGLAIGFLFVVGNWLLLKRDLLVSIHQHAPNNYGTVFFPAAFMILCIGFWNKPILFSAAMIVMAIADPLASTVGRHVRRPKEFSIWEDKKSMEGTVFMFIASFLLLMVTYILGSWYMHQLQYLPLAALMGIIGLVAMITTFGEITSKNGSDNFTIPLLVAFFSDLFIIQYNLDLIFPIFIWMVGSSIIFIFSVNKRWLTKDGAVLAWIMGIIIFSTHGLVWIIPLFAFFITSSLLTRSNNIESEHQTKNGRNLYQVAANGGVATAIAIWSFTTNSDRIAPLFLAAIAAAAADTWATEIGMRSKHPPRHCLTLKPMKAGDSGGITVLGIVGSLFGAILISSVGFFFNLDLQQMLIIALAGLIGSFMDSVLGGTIQAKYQCSSCGQIIEQTVHCHHKAELISGWRPINNDVINGINTLAAVILVYLLVN